MGIKRFMENLPYVKSSEEGGSTESNSGSGNEGVSTSEGSSHAGLELVHGVGIGYTSVSGNHLTSLESPETSVGSGRLGLVVGDGERSIPGKTSFEILTLGSLRDLVVLDLFGSRSRGNTVVDTSGGKGSGGTGGV